MTGNELKELLKENNLTQKEAAAKLGVSEVTMSKQINRGNENVSPSTNRKAVIFRLTVVREELQKANFKLYDICGQILELLKVN